MEDAAEYQCDWECHFHVRGDDPIAVRAEWERHIAAHDAMARGASSPTRGEAEALIEAAIVGPANWDHDADGSWQWSPSSIATSLIVAGWLRVSGTSDQEETPR